MRAKGTKPVGARVRPARRSRKGAAVAGAPNLGNNQSLARDGKEGAKPAQLVWVADTLWTAWLKG